MNHNTVRLSTSSQTGVFSATLSMEMCENKRLAGYRLCSAGFLLSICGVILLPIGIWESQNEDAIQAKKFQGDDSYRFRMQAMAVAGACVLGFNIPLMFVGAYCWCISGGNGRLQYEPELTRPRPSAQQHDPDDHPQDFQAQERITMVTTEQHQRLITTNTQNSRTIVPDEMPPPSYDEAIRMCEIKEE